MLRHLRRDAIRDLTWVRGQPEEPTLSVLIAAAERGEGAAAEALFGALYAELHRMAQRELARRGAAVSLSVTTLLHEAYLDMAARDGPSFPDRARFMGYAARVMRGVAIDSARRQHAPKRGGQFSRSRPSAPKSRRSPTSSYLDLAMEMTGPERDSRLASLGAHDPLLANDLQTLLEERGARGRCRRARELDRPSRHQTDDRLSDAVCVTRSWRL